MKKNQSIKVEFSFQKKVGNEIERIKDEKKEEGKESMTIKKEIMMKLELETQIPKDRRNSSFFFNERK